MDLAQAIIAAVNRYWAQEVQILGSWEDAPAAVCVVYRRTIDPNVTLGRRLEFHENPADGTGSVEGFAREAAINLAEPIGIQASRTRQDQHGIVWVAIPENTSTPKPPVEILRNVSGR